MTKQSLGIEYASDSVMFEELKFELAITEVTSVENSNRRGHLSPIKD